MQGGSVGVSYSQSTPATLVLASCWVPLVSDSLVFVQSSRLISLPTQATFLRCMVLFGLPYLDPRTATVPVITQCDYWTNIH